MTTNTDTEWTTRLQSILGSGFAANGGNSFSSVSNSVCTALMNRIGMTVVRGADDPANVFARYDKDMMEYGDVLQMIKVQYQTGDDYDPEDTNPFALAKGTAVQSFWTQDDSVQYCQSIWDRELKRAFSSRENFDRFITAQLDALEKSNLLDKRTKWKKYLTESTALTDDSVTISVDANEHLTGTGPQDLLDRLRSYANNLFREPSTSYNTAGDTAISSEVDIIMRREDKLAIDKILAGVYNLEKTDLDANIVLVDDFATPPNTAPGTTLLACVVDRRALGYYPTQITPSAQYNGKALYQNTFLTIEGVYTVDPTANAVRIYGA